MARSADCLESSISLLRQTDKVWGLAALPSSLAACCPCKVSHGAVQKGCRVACGCAGVGIAADANHMGPQGLHTFLHSQILFTCSLSSCKPVMLSSSADLEMVIQGAQGSGRHPSIIQIPKQNERPVSHELLRHKASQWAVLSVQATGPSVLPQPPPADTCAHPSWPEKCAAGLPSFECDVGEAWHHRPWKSNSTLPD